MKFTPMLLGAALLFSGVSPLLASADGTVVPVAGGVNLLTTTRIYNAVAVGHRASKIIGATVYNDDNHAIGKVSDLVVTPTDNVSFFILSVGGFLGMGAKDIAVNASRFMYAKNRVLLPNASKDELTRLPAFHFAR